MVTKEEIQLSINSRLVSPPTIIEGGSIQDMIGAVSYELANIVSTQIDPCLDNAFILTAEEEFLIVRGNELGVAIREATSAIVYAQITNASPLTTIEGDVFVQTNDGIIFKNIAPFETDESGNALIKMECVESGVAGNIEKDTLVEFQEVYEGLENAEITNPSNGFGGYDREDVEQYRKRLLEFLRDGAANSNIADYTKWAKSVAGVNRVLVKDAMKTGNPGQVEVYISAYDNAEVTNELLNRVKTYIESQQIINAKLIIKALEYEDININAQVVLESGYLLEEVKKEFSSIFQNYLENVQNEISYLYVSNLFFKVNGINDVVQYTLNSASANLILNDSKVPVVGNIVLTTVSEE